MGWTSTGKREKPERKPELVIPEGGKVGQVLALTENGLVWSDLPNADLGEYGMVKMANYSYDMEEDTQTNFENLIDALKSAGIIGSVE